MSEVPLVYETYQTLTDPNAVATNRQGELTAAQRGRLERASRAPIWVVTIVMLVFGAAFLVPSLSAVGLLRRGQIHTFSLVCGIPCSLVGLLFVVLAFVSPFAMRKRNAAIAVATHEGTIVQAEGEVIFSGRFYVAYAGGQRLRTARGLTVPLPPGRYRFYYLPQPPILLSAESLEPPAAPVGGPPAIDPLLGLPGYVPTATPDGTSQYAAVDPAFNGLLDALARSNRFTLEELRLNRSGRMSGRQARRLVFRLLLRAVLTLCLVGMGCLPIVITMMRHMPVTPVVFFSVGFGLASILVVPRGVKGAIDGIARRAAAIEGPVEPLRNGSEEHTGYYYRLSGKRLRVGARAYQALIPGITYRVYYAPRSMTLLSIEPISAAAPAPEGASGF